MFFPLELFFSLHTAREPVLLTRTGRLPLRWLHICEKDVLKGSWLQSFFVASLLQSRLWTQLEL